MEHLALMLIEAVGFWLFSGLAYFPPSVSAPVVSDLMKLNGLHLVHEHKKNYRLSVSCSGLEIPKHLRNAKRMKKTLSKTSSQVEPRLVYQESKEVRLNHMGDVTEPVPTFLWV